ncbi:ABC transporter permease [Oryzomonas rubra]|uniref:ABC transporter permease subunit n=1 Tax=Oryzomonas rubra TaxID=2509454 RepID=A0A5A9XD38_9BACT|nr:ABC transporter permease subunit [Oryzomonas rubra]KAA0890453.1 ABC transporter permease subunit [Oryzomonas rubra]
MKTDSTAVEMTVRGTAMHEGSPSTGPGILAQLWDRGWVRRAGLLILLCALWEWYAARLANPLMVPTFSATLQALVDAVGSGGLPARIVTSFKILLTGYGIGVLLALILAMVATMTRLGSDLLELCTSMFNPLPAIALLPLALLWFGLGNGSIIFVLIHAVLWPVALSAHGGFSAVNGTIRMVGRNYGLSGIRYAAVILIPAAFPSLLTGLRNGWAFAWRTLIAAELVFGVSSGSGGIGWFIYENKQQLDIPSVFAGLITVILIGIAVENLIFDRLERATVVKWGMKSSGGRNVKIRSAA